MEKDFTCDWIAILDFGSPYTQLIARRIRELKVYSEIYPHNIAFSELLKNNPRGIILSGNADNLNNEQVHHLVQQLSTLDVPILGIGQPIKILIEMCGGKLNIQK